MTNFGQLKRAGQSIELFCLSSNSIALSKLDAFSPFPEVAEAVQEELEEYRSKEDEVKRLKHAMVRIAALRFFDEMV